MEDVKVFTLTGMSASELNGALGEFSQQTKDQIAGLALSNGAYNPGAMSVAAELYDFCSELDIAEEDKGPLWDFLRNTLITNAVTGPNLWVLYKDHCDSEVDETFQEIVFRGEGFYKAANGVRRYA